MQSITATAGGLSGSQTGITVSGTPATATFVEKNTTTNGNWVSTYGTQGYDAIGYAASLPSYATVNPSNDTFYTWSSSTSNTSALQNPANPTGSRIAACWYSTNNTLSFSINVNITDGQTHDLELYFLDYTNAGRAETVQISDATIGTVLDTETVSSFSKGVYLQWKVSGDIVITLTKTAGPSAAAQRPLLRPTLLASGSGDRFLPRRERPATNAGNWVGTYGTQGYDAIGYAASLPSYATVTPSNDTFYTWSSSTTNTSALQNPANPTGSRVAACWYSTNNTPSFTINVNITDGQTHDLELYFLDYTNAGRAETVQISDATTGTVLDTETVSSFSKGVYLQWEVSGDIVITLTKTAGPSALLSGLFFDAVGTPGTAGLAVTHGTHASPSSPMLVGSAIARESIGGLAIVPAAGPVDAVLGTLADDDDPTLTAPGSSIYDLAMEHVSARRTTVTR